ncbi:MAG: ABC transporter ATP-binding protein [Candidatus Neomarinimicrobiota bacterium]|nr:ABC transporter ATP-binding protein [Candidatus Neomarinimicrobiota bacterium]
MDKVILEAKGLVKSFVNGNNKLKVLDGIDIKLEEGKIVTIMGKSGSGKSTLLNILSTLDGADEGMISIKGNDINYYTDNEISYMRNSYIGFVFQFHHLLPDFTVLENILMPDWINKTNSKKGRALELLDLLELIMIKDKYPLELSGGERQRVAVLRALINNPKILFADEPTGNLDEKNALILVDLFRQINRDYSVTILLTTHNPDVAAIGDVRYELKSGLLEKK